MDSVSDILGHKDFSEPAEAATLKRYVEQEFQTVINVMVRERDIILSVPSAALANTLHLRTPELRQLCQTDKRFVFRIV